MQQVGKYLEVVERLEKVQRPVSGARENVNRLALATAQELDSMEAPDSRLGLQVKVCG